VINPYDRNNPVWKHLTDHLARRSINAIPGIRKGTTMSQRRIFIAGNWKMYKTSAETTEYIQRFKSLLTGEPAVDITVAPPFPALEAAVTAASDSPIKIAAQNVFWESEGAYTGEVSVNMLKSINVSQVIIGHSERRQHFKETDRTVNKRVKAALAGDLQPIICIGETLEEREAEKTFEILKRQINGALENVPADDFKRVVFAYEPVWAIGTGKTATPEIAQDAHAFIRAQFEKLYDKNLANEVRILYGGSVKPGNAADLMAQLDIDGALVGGASLKPDVFIEIVNYR
jgi:triosephosphate isomerase (TIM)